MNYFPNRKLNATPKNMVQKKKKKDIVYSTNPNFEYTSESDLEPETLLPIRQNLKVWLDRKQRGGKTVSLVKGFIGTSNDLKTLGSELKATCGVGGTVKAGEIIIQGDHRDKIVAHLQKKGYGARKAGG